MYYTQLSAYYSRKNTRASPKDVLSNQFDSTHHIPPTAFGHDLAYKNTKSSLFVTSLSSNVLHLILHSHCWLNFTQTLSSKWQARSGVMLLHSTPGGGELVPHTAALYHINTGKTSTHPCHISYLNPSNAIAYYGLVICV